MQGAVFADGMFATSQTAGAQPGWMAPPLWLRVFISCRLHLLGGAWFGAA